MQEFYGWIGLEVHAFSRDLDRQQAYIDQQFSQTPKTFSGAVAQSSSADYAASVAGWVEIREAWRSLQRWLGRHPIAADVVATGFDMIGVVGGVIGFGLALSTMFTPLGAAAFVGSLSMAAGSVALLIADSRDGYLRIKGDMAAKLGFQTSAVHSALETARWEHSSTYRRAELLAPILTLPGVVTDTAGAAVDVARADAIAGRAASMVEDSSRALGSAKYRLETSDNAYSQLTKLVQNYSQNGPSPASRRAIIAHMEKMQNDPIVKTPRAALKLDVQKTTKALKAALVAKANAERELQMTWANATIVPKMEKLGNPFLGLSKVPALPPTVDYAGLSAIGVLTPGMLDTVLPPLSGRARSGASHAPPEILSFSIFVSTKSGQPGS
ncbi:MAG: hypothetical protein ACYCZB_14710 [Acidiphilium sp.]